MAHHSTTPVVLATMALSAMLALQGCGQSPAPAPQVVIITHTAEGKAVIDEDALVILVGTGFSFTEGPLWMPDASWIFTDLMNAIQHKWVPATKVLSDYRKEEEATNWINGATLDNDGNLLTCEMGARRISRTNLTTGVREVILDQYQGNPFTGPNDVVVTKDGIIYFTDTDYGRGAHGGVNEIGSNNVYRYDPKTQDLTAVVTDMDTPNGLAFSPDEQILYVTDSGASQPILGTPMNFSMGHEVRSYDVAEDGTTSNGQTFWETPEAEEVPDGIKVDINGNVWSSSHAGVKVFKPDGTLIAEISTPATTANLAFGGSDGKDLMLTSSDSVWVVKTKTTSPVGLRHIEVQV